VCQSALNIWPWTGIEDRGKSECMINVVIDVAVDVGVDCDRHWAAV